MIPSPVFVVDDDPGVRNSLRFLLNSSGRQVLSFKRGEDFLARHDMLEAGPVLLDVCLGGISGMGVLEELARRASSMQVILITGHGDIAMAVEAMKAGACDFLTKPFSREDLFDKIANADRRLADGRVETAHRQSSLSRIEVLTERELGVLSELSRGLPNKAIGHELGISSRTVEIHRANVMRKLGTHNLADTLRIAFAAGMPWSVEEVCRYAGHDGIPSPDESYEPEHVGEEKVQP